jgi:hypothetical protein
MTRNFWLALVSLIATIIITALIIELLYTVFQLAEEHISISINLAGQRLSTR